jgi:putative acetyltransferase
MNIRLEQNKDIDAIFSLNLNAFETDEEANIVNSLRSNGNLILSMVAVEGDHVVGHIAFSPMKFENSGVESKIVALAPMAVTPSKQRQGIGSKLVKEALKILQERDFEGVLLIGHPGFYPKFGFKPAGSTFGLKSEFDVPEEVFLGLELGQTGFSGVKGVAHFCREFSPS